MTPERWTKQIDEATAAFQKAFGQLSYKALNQKPDSGTWSIAQNIDHLITINESYYPTFEALEKGSYRTPWIGKLGFMATFLGNFVLQSVQPDRKRKMKTFPIWEPAQSSLPADILDRFAEHQEQLKAWIGRLEGPLSAGAVIASPANKNIVYKLETAFDIITAHEWRHLEQARHVAPPRTGRDSSGKL